MFKLHNRYTKPIKLNDEFQLIIDNFNYKNLEYGDLVEVTYVYAGLHSTWYTVSKGSSRLTLTYAELIGSLIKR